MRYILNSAVITNWGYWLYKPISLEEAREWLNRGPFISTIRYKETAETVYQLTGIYVPRSNVTIQMEPGDEALVFRLRFEIGAARVAQELKGKLTPEFVRKYLEIGILKMLGAPHERPTRSIPQASQDNVNTDQQRNQ